MKSAPNFRLTTEQQKFVEANLKLAYYIASQFYSKGHHERDEIEAEALFGLTRAAATFDASRVWQFSTYAQFWIKQRIFDYSIRNRRGQISFTASSNARKVLFASSKEKIDSLEMSDALLDRHSAMLSAIAIQIDHPIGNDEDFSLELPCERERVDQRLERDASRIELKRAIRDALSGLRERTRFVLVERYLKAGQQPTLAELGVRLGITRERVRQIEHNGLCHVRKVLMLKSSEWTSKNSSLAA